MVRDTVQVQSLADALKRLEGMPSGATAEALGHPRVPGQGDTRPAKVAGISKEDGRWQQRDTNTGR